jgi:p-aminobenzoyl-glutamate transporter AbgT
MMPGGDVTGDMITVLAFLVVLASIAVLASMAVLAFMTILPLSGLWFLEAGSSPNTSIRWRFHGVLLSKPTEQVTRCILRSFLGGEETAFAVTSMPLRLA